MWNDLFIYLFILENVKNRIIFYFFILKILKIYIIHWGVGIFLFDGEE